MSFEERLDPILAEFTERTQLLSVRSAQAGMMTELSYGLQLKENVLVSSLVERLQIATGNNRIVLTPTGTELNA